MLALAQPAPVGGLKQDLIVPTVQQAVVSPRWRGQGVGWGGWAGRAPRSGAAGGSSRNDEEEDLEIGLKEGPSLWRGEWGRGGRSSAPARGLRQGLQGDAHRSLWSSPEASGSQLHSPWGRGRECGLSRVGESL